MSKYILRRFLQFIPTLFLTIFLIFFAMSKAGGSSTSYVLPENSTDEQIKEYEHQLGLDKNIFLRFIDYIKGVVKGDMGVSYITGEDVFKTFVRYLPNTVYLSFLSLFISISISIPLGIVSALNKGKIKDILCSFFSLLGISMPAFWLALILILFFSLKLKIFPSGGSGTLLHLVLPSVCNALGLSALIARTTRSAMLEVINQDYIMFARSKGISERRIIYHHCLRNAMVGILTSINQQLSLVMTGSVLVETIFSYPGVGRLIYQSINSRDIPMVTGSIVACCFIMSMISLLTDIAYTFFDPQMKEQILRKA